MEMRGSLRSDTILLGLVAKPEYDTVLTDTNYQNQYNPDQERGIRKPSVNEHESRQIRKNDLKHN